MTRIVASLLLPFALCAPLLSWTATPAQGAAGERAKLVVGETHVAELPAEGGGAAASAEWHLAAEASETVTVALESYDFDAFVAVRAPDGATVEADLGGLGTDARATLDVAAGAAYVVRVERRAGNGGAYTLRVERDMPALPQGVERQAAELAYWDEAARRAHERGDARRELLGLRVAAQVEIALGRRREAAARFERALASAEDAGEVGEALFARALLGRLLQQLGRTQEALPLLLRSREELAATRLDELRAAVLLGLADVRFARGELDDAEAHLREALELVRARGYAHLEPSVSGRLADVLAERGSMDEALSLLEREIGLAEAQSDEEHARALAHEALFMLRRGELEIARDAVRLALELAHDDGVVQVDALGISADLQQALGHLAEARALYAEVLTRAEALGDRNAACLALDRLASIATKLGQHERARAMFEEALAREPDEGIRVRLWNGLGLLHGACSELEERIAAHEQALEIARTAQLSDDAVRTLIALAEARQRLGDLEQARANAEAAQALARSAGRRDLIALTELNLGYLDLLEGRPAEARGRTEGALTELGPLADADARLAGLETLARASIALGEADRARISVDEASALLEAPARTGLDIQEASAWRSTQAWWAETLQQDLTELVVTTSAPGSPERARAVERGFEACGLWKQRALREVLAQRRGGAADAHPGTVSAAETRAVAIEPGRVLIEYAVGSSRLFAYVLTQDALRLVELGERASIEESLRRYLAAISEPSTLGTARDVARLGHVLYLELLAPALAALDTQPETLVIVPSTALAALPFEALVCDLEVPAAEVLDLTQVEFVLDRCLVTYVPSTPVLIELARTAPRESPGRALLLGDPLYATEADARLAQADAPLEIAARRSLPAPEELTRLIGTREEALTVARLLLAQAGDGGAEELLDAMGRRSVALETGSFTLCLGEDANAGRLLSGLNDYRVLHVGAHGFIDPDEPRNTGIALAGAAGFVSISDVAGLDLDLDLAVLSACQTALGPIRSGEGVQSLANAFLHAGARAVVASLWQVRDLETSSLMRDFYRARLGDGLPTARALRDAKLAQRTARGVRGRYVDGLAPPLITAGHPYFWASCIYAGLPE